MQTNQTYSMRKNQLLLPAIERVEITFCNSVERPKREVLIFRLIRSNDIHGAVKYIRMNQYNQERKISFTYHLN